MRDGDKARAVEVGRALDVLGFALVATRGTANALIAAGLKCVPINKVAEGRPHIVDMIKNAEIVLAVNTVEETRKAIKDSYAIRRAALQHRVPVYTTIAGARAACAGMAETRELHAYAVQDLHKRLAAV